MIKALPIRHNGTLFRSRLEADWASTLDSYGITWQYEPEGFQLSDGTCYSPDFYLPSARAWLEVKGSHMMGVTKAERFAADLWVQSGATSTHDLDAPMVLLGRDPMPRDVLLIEGERISITGIMGFGKAYSVALATCPACDQGTALALWQPYCRGCLTRTDGGMEFWSEAVFDSWMKPFRRVVRPAGGRSR